MSEAEDRSLEREIAKEQIALVASHTPRVLIGLLVLDGFLVWLLAGVQLLHFAVAWIAGSLLLQGLRWYHLSRGLRPEVDPLRATRQLTVLFGVIGWVRASIIPLVFQQPMTGVQHVFTMVMLGQMAGAAGSLAGLHKSYLAWGGPIVLLLAAGWWTVGSFEGRWIAVLLVLLFVVLWQNVRASNATVRELVHLARERQRLVESKARFFAAANHDLRQPLHALAINATTLEVVARRAQDPAISELSRSISKALQQCDGLLDALLDISKLDSGTVALRIVPLDLGLLAHSVTEDFLPIAAARGLTLTACVFPGQALVVNGDRELMLRILNNLVSNALKFTEHGGAKVIAGRDGAEVVVVVEDTGPGIPSEEQARVFEEFYQIGNRARDRSRGLGLGLSIVKRSCALLGARVSLYSPPGGGCRFEVRMPAVQAQQAGIAPEREGPRELPSLRCSVLAIDDEPEILQSVAALLGAMGCTVRCARSLEEARSIAQGGFMPGVLLVDHRLSGQTGPDVISRLRDELGPIPALLITGDTEPDVLRQGAVGQWRVLHKPLDGWQLAEELQTAVGRDQAA